MSESDGTVRSLSKGFVRDYTDLLAYRTSFKLSKEIFEVTKQFPKEEMYSLTDQFRRAIRSLRSKWAAGKTRGGRISESIRNRRATRPPAHFHRNPSGRGELAVFPRCSLLTYQFRYARRSRLEKQPTDLRRKTCYFGDRTLVKWLFVFLVNGDH